MSAKLNAALIKQLTSGGNDDQVGRGHYEAERKFLPTFAMFMMGNDFPDIEPFDDAIKTRLFMIEYTKKYVDFPTGEHELLKNPTITSRVKEEDFKMCFLHVLMDALKRSVSKPQASIEAAQQMIDDQDVMTDFEESFTLTGKKEDWVSSSDLMAYFAGQSISAVRVAQNIKGLAKRLGVTIEQYSPYVNGKRTRGWRGIRKFSSTSS